MMAKIDMLRPMMTRTAWEMQKGTFTKGSEQDHDIWVPDQKPRSLEQVEKKQMGAGNQCQKNHSLLQIYG